MMQFMDRVPEPERMTEVEEAHYARADYAEPHEQLVTDITALVDVSDETVAMDLGCGPGDVLLRLRKRVNWTLIGVDISAQMLGFAQADAARRLGMHIKPVAWLLADSKSTGLPSGFADIIISNSVLHHLADPVAFWREVGRLARPGAHVFVRDLRRPRNESAAKELVAKHVGRESEVIREHYLSSLRASYTTDEVFEQLAESGLQGLAVRPLQDRYLDVCGRVLK